MIKINFDEPVTELWRNWREKCNEETRKLIELVRNGSKPVFKSYVYKGKAYGIKDEYYVNRDKPPFYGKCAYCEQGIFGNQFGDIEHYRPKAEVRRQDNSLVMIDLDGIEAPHPGYYWLAYDWHNLLPACELCNALSRRGDNDRRIGKGNRFPVNGSHAAKPGDEEQEEALLINPLIDDPKDHIEFTALGVANARDDRGSACIDIFGLNERGLPDDRKEAYQTARHRLSLLLNHLESGDETSDQIDTLREHLKSVKDGVSKFSAAGRRGLYDYLQQTTAEIELGAD